MSQLRDMIRRHEGLRTKPYKDSVGILTIGVGRNLEHVGISESEAMFLLDNDISVALAEVARALPWAGDLNEVRQDVLVDMAFNMGIGRLKGFKRMLAALRDGDYVLAASEMMDSKWARQVGYRAHELSNMMRRGTYNGTHS